MKKLTILCIKRLQVLRKLDQICRNYNHCVVVMGLIYPLGTGGTVLRVQGAFRGPGICFNFF